MVTTAKKTTSKAAKKAAPRPPADNEAGSQARFPRHSVDRALRIPRAILEQNAGHSCTRADAARLLGGTASGAFNLEVSTAKKYGFLETEGSKLAITERAKRALRPQAEGDEVAALREAVLAAPDISDVYSHYRGEFLPDETFLTNALVERFGIPRDKLTEFLSVFNDSLRVAQLLDSSGERVRVLDIGRDESHRALKSERASDSTRTTDGSCFVVQPFAAPYGEYYESIFRTAIEQTGLKPVRADAEIFGSGKIMDQVWRGISSAKVLVAELTTRNPNVFYELGLAHALGKPVVLISSNEGDVPFDLHHIRVIYYDMTDPFWGQKLIDKIADNIRSALANPEEATFRVDESSA